MRLTISVIALTLLPASWALALTSTTVSFQNGINGYTGTFDRYINDGTSSTTSPAIAQTDGSIVQSYSLNGFLSGTTQDSQGLIRFDNIFGNAVGQIPSGAFILDAQLRLTTEGGSTANGFTGQSNAATPTDISGSVGPFGVAGLLQSFSSTTDYYTDFPNPGDPFGGRGPYYTANGGTYATRPVGSFGSAAVGQTVSAPVTSLVQKWSSGTLANNGMAIQAGFDGASDDWQIHTTGYTTPEGRPKLTVTYTTDPVSVKTFQPGVGSYADSSLTMARVVGGASPATTDGATITTSGPLDGLDATTAEQLALVKFSDVFGGGVDQADPTKPVAKAWMVLTTSTGANSRTNDPYDVDVVRNPWTTTTLYNQFGANPGLQFADGDTTPTLSRVVGSANGSEAWYDVTSYLEAVRNGATDNGLAVRARGTDGWTILFNGATDTSLRPRLVVASQTTTGGSLQGDFNNDTVVDAKDFVAWRKGVVPSTPANYALWRSNFGNTGNSTPPPAPTTLMNYDLMGLPSSSPPANWDPNAVQLSGTGLVLPNSSQSAKGMSGLALSRGPGLAAGGLANGFSANNWTNVTADGGTIDKARAITNGDYFQFGATVDGSHKASLSTLDFALRRSAVASPMNYEVQVSLDGFATAGTAIADFQYLGRVSGNAPDPDLTLITPDRYMTLDTAGRPDTTVTPGDQVTTIDLAAFAFLQNLTNKTITFRLYAWGDGAATAANSNTVAFGRENGPRIMGFIVDFPGAGASLVSVPEPGTVLLMSVFAFVFGAFGDRRR